MHEGKGAVDRQIERQFFHADEHQRRHLARAPGHRQNEAGHDARQRPGQHDPPDCLPLAGAARIRPLPHRVGNGGKRLLGGHDHHRQRQQGERERRPEQAAGAKRGLIIGHEARAEKEFVDAATKGVAEKAQAERAVDDARHAGEVVDRDPHRRGHGPRRRILPEIECRQHAKWGHEERHNQRHGDGAPDRGKHAAGTVRLPRIVAEKLTPATAVDAEFAGQ